MTVKFDNKNDAQCFYDEIKGGTYAFIIQYSKLEKYNSLKEHKK